MDKVKPLSNVPEKSIIADNFGKINYIDSFQIIKPANSSIDKIAVDIFDSPKWVDWLMKTRHTIVRIFGLKTQKEKNEEILDYYPVGSNLSGFPVIARNNDEIVMGMDDKHLNFKASVMYDKENSQIYLTTIVHYNNWFGRFYFFFVKPFHKMLLKAQMKRVLKKR